MDLNWLDSKIAMKDLTTNSHLCEISHKLVGYLPSFLVNFYVLYLAMIAILLIFM